MATITTVAHVSAIQGQGFCGAKMAAYETKAGDPIYEEKIVVTSPVPGLN